MDIPRIEPNVAHDRAEDGDALIVCAYEDEDTCADMGVENAIPLSRFEEQVDDLDRRQEIIFYCN